MTIILLLKPKARRVQSNWIGYIPKPKKARKPSRVDKRKQQEEKEKLTRLVRLRKGEKGKDPTIEFVELPEQIQEQIDRQSKTVQNDLIAKLYEEILFDIKAEFLKVAIDEEKARRKFKIAEEAKISLESIYSAWQKAKTMQDYEDLILLMVASEDI